MPSSSQLLASLSNIEFEKFNFPSEGSDLNEIRAKARENAHIQGRNIDDLNNLVAALKDFAKEIG